MEGGGGPVGGPEDGITESDGPTDVAPSGGPRFGAAIDGD